MAETVAPHVIADTRGRWWYETAMAGVWVAVECGGGS